MISFWDPSTFYKGWQDTVIPCLSPYISGKTVSIYLTAYRRPSSTEEEKQLESIDFLSFSGQFLHLFCCYVLSGFSQGLNVDILFWVIDRTCGQTSLFRVRHNPSRRDLRKNTDFFIARTSLSPGYHPITVIADRIKNYQNNKVQNKTQEALVKHESSVLRNSGPRTAQYVPGEKFGGKNKMKEIKPLC